MSRRKRSVSALLSNDEESITVRSSRKNRAISRVIDEESEESTLIIHTHDRRMVPCNFSKCNGKIVDVFTKLNHEADRDLDDNQDSEVVQDYSNPLSSSFEDYSNPLYTCSQNPLVLAKVLALDFGQFWFTKPFSKTETLAEIRNFGRNPKLKSETFY
ncbi:hypothetical protein RhiirC2_714010 [Rhizophagus irregularis]|uniref:Uncharacterized protein n=1 Tax=Rhizophagus irregularis TaxID=588596 RepID=A0A2N1N0Y6_9GLOM|nr:hypothetical protein RhiirC2_714010 [Rhizophagus irregularis]